MNFDIGVLDVPILTLPFDATFSCANVTAGAASVNKVIKSFFILLFIELINV